MVLCVCVLCVCVFIVCLWMSLCIWACLCIFLYICMCLCMFVCLYVCTCIWEYVLCACTCIHVCVGNKIPSRLLPSGSRTPLYFEKIVVPSMTGVCLCALSLAMPYSCLICGSASAKQGVLNWALPVFSAAGNNGPTFHIFSDFPPIPKAGSPCGASCDLEYALPQS